MQGQRRRRGGLGTFVPCAVAVICAASYPRLLALDGAERQPAPSLPLLRCGRGWLADRAGHLEPRMSLRGGATQGVPGANMELFEASRETAADTGDFMREQFPDMSEIASYSEVLLLLLRYSRYRS